MLCRDWTDAEEEAERIEDMVGTLPDSVARAGSDPRVLASLAEAIWSSDPAGDEFVRWVDLQSCDQ
jgi:hypothetical protein